MKKINRDISIEYKVYRKVGKKRGRVENYVDWGRRINENLDARKKEITKYEDNLRGILRKKMRSKKVIKEIIMGIQLPMWGVLISIMIAMTGMAENAVNNMEEVYKEIEEMESFFTRQSEIDKTQEELIKQKQVHIQEKLQRYEENTSFLLDMYMRIYMIAGVIAFLCCVGVIYLNEEINYYVDYLQILEEREQREYENKNRFYMEIMV